MSLMKASEFETFTCSESSGPRRTLLALTLSSFRLLMYRESRAPEITGAATLTSAASCTVHLPVPLLPALSRIYTLKVKLLEQRYDNYNH